MKTNYEAVVCVAWLGVEKTLQIPERRDDRSAPQISQIMTPSATTK